MFSLAPNPLLDGLAGLPIKVPFHSIIGNLGEYDAADSTDGVVSYYSSHLEGAESEKIIPVGHDLIANPATVSEIKRILEKNLAHVVKHYPSNSVINGRKAMPLWPTPAPRVFKPR